MERDCGYPKLDRKDRDLGKHNWKRRAFYRTKHGLFFHMPIAIGRAIQKGIDAIKGRKYTFSSPYMMLDEETAFFQPTYSLP